jgi:hypothetical protein
MKKILNKIRAWLIIRLAGNSLIIVNAIISRPFQYEGQLIKWLDKNRFGLINNCILLGQQWTEGIIAPMADYPHWRKWL